MPASGRRGGTRHRRDDEALPRDGGSVKIADTGENIAPPTLDARRLERALQTLAQDWLSVRCAVAVGALQDLVTTGLFPSEVLPNANVHPRRQATFRAGRACAHTALGELGGPAVAIPIGTSGAPIWPDGFAGSISHTDEIAAAVVARSPPVRGFGLDLERDKPLDDATMVRLVCRPDELIRDGDPSHHANRRRGKLLFVVKEAVYKLYRPLTGAFLDFQDLRVLLDQDASAFRAELFDPALPSLGGIRTLTGRFAEAEGFVMALTAYVETG